MKTWFQSPIRRIAAVLLRGQKFPSAFIYLLYSARYFIQGDSMEPSLSDGQHVLVTRIAYSIEPPIRGDIVVLNDPWQDGKDYVKRLVGLPGELILIQDGRLSVDGCFFPEAYLEIEEERSSFPAKREWVVGNDEYLVFGDRRSDSRDSRRLGAVNKHCIVGKVWVRYWPWRRFGRLC